MPDFWNAELAQLNDTAINWNPEKPVCSECNPSKPQAGSYASTLGHYEQVMGALPGPRNPIRFLLLFQDPRPQDQFDASPPLKDPAELGLNEHRYFCLTPVAWQDLGLERTTHSRTPCWPTEQTARHYLRRYFQNGSWSYDGFLAYFFYLFRPCDAYVTNLAKCYFEGEGTGAQTVKYGRCAKKHLSLEIKLFAPDVILSFTSRAKTHLNQICGDLQKPPLLLQAYHPAYHWITPEEKRMKFKRDLENSHTELEDLGMKNMTEVIKNWNRHAGQVIAGE